MFFGIYFIQTELSSESYCSVDEEPFVFTQIVDAPCFSSFAKIRISHNVSLFKFKVPKIVSNLCFVVLAKSRRQYSGPWNRESIELDSDIPHELDIFLEKVVRVVSCVSVVMVKHSIRELMGISVPDAFGFPWRRKKNNVTRFLGDQ